MEEERVETPRRNAGKLRRQRSRLQMHAPSSIQVGPPTMAAAAAAEWTVAIPLLSPLDVVAVPWATDRAVEAEAPSSREVVRPPAVKTEDKEEQQGGARWRHPAMPFCYEPVPGNSPAFLLPHCM